MVYTSACLCYQVVHKSRKETGLLRISSQCQALRAVAQTMVGRLFRIFGLAFRSSVRVCGSRRPTNCMNSFFKRLFLADFWKGMILTFRTQNPKNIYTEQYPQERPMVAERYRGAPRLNMNPETGETLCISCNLCALACPENLIVVGWHRDDATRRKVLTTFTYDTSRCMFCGLCEDACSTDCLELTQDFELASYTREGAIWDRHRLEEGPTPARYTR